jgi:nucleotide-binding universal stress UspA family protein
MESPMRFKDIAVALTTYPDPTPSAALGQIARLCGALGDAACGVAVSLKFPVKSNRLANMLVGLDDLAKAEERRSRDQAHAVLVEFHKLAADLGLATSELVLSAEIYDASEQVASAVRTRDLCVVPYLNNPAPQRGLAEAIIFASGRPVVVFGANEQTALPERFSKIAVAWDGGSASARTLADALPLLGGAREVQVVTVLNEKPSAGPGAATALMTHLGRHGINATAVEVDAAGKSIGAALRRWLAENTPQLLVMGAFGHSRAREFILGGATRDMLDDPPVPVFLSH